MKRQRAVRDAGYTDKGKDATRLARLTNEQLIHLFNLVGDHTEIDGCFITKRTLNAQGYPDNVSVGVKLLGNALFRPDFPFVATQVVLAFHGKFAEDRLDEASHLCHNRACVNPDHLVWESRHANESRKNCAGVVVCECGKTHILCKHTPKCIVKH